MKVVKYSGKIEEFNPEKIIGTILRAGGSKKLASEAVQEVIKNYHEGMTTKEVLNITLGFLKKEPGVPERYDLKRAIMSLGPSGFPFEIFFASVLENYGYKTEVGEKIIGRGFVYEVDIIAEKEKKFMVECKYHNKVGIITKIRYAKKAYERFLDLKSFGFNQPWLSTNTKCSYDAIEYAKNVNMKITTWTYPKTESLRELIEKKRLYPVTILKSLKPRIKERLYNSKILIAKDLLKYSPEELRQKTRLPEKEIKEILRKVREVVGAD
ncbi:MAG: ATP cone domain-containing protein [Nanoarchaeota archaeon]|nr:ATP cone domain-containing protein [Nanoarchaeota archaeon]